MPREIKILQETVSNDVMVIDEDDFESYKSTKKSVTRRKKHKIKNKYKRKVKVNKVKNVETLIITQKVEVKKQKFRCVINLTNICERKNVKQSRVVIEESEERIVPKCLRKCSRHHEKKMSKSRESSKHVKHERKYEPKCDLGSLSSISLSSIEKYSELSYEDVSSDSFTVQSDEDIDTLIKRTKERERTLSKSFEGVLPLCTSTPKCFESISDTETAILRNNDMDTSIHSTKTLILEPQPALYSPTNPDLDNEHEMIKIDEYYDYSLNRTGEEVMNLERNKCNNLQTEDKKYNPISTLHNSPKNLFANYLHSEKPASSLNTVQKCDIKCEPYSPPPNPMCCEDPKQFPYEVHVKFEKTPVHSFDYDKAETEMFFHDNIDIKPNLTDLKGRIYSHSRSFQSFPQMSESQDEIPKNNTIKSEMPDNIVVVKKEQ